MSIKTVAIMPPGIKVFQLAVGGGTAFMEEPTRAAKQVVATAIEEELARHEGVVFKSFSLQSAGLDTSTDPAAGGIQAELEDTQALFEAVSASVLLHVHGYPDQRFPEKLKNFDYSLGPDVQRLAKLANADALLFTSGVDHISSGARKSLLALEAILSSPTVLVPPYAMVVAMEIAGQSGKVILSVALVDATTGALLWYSVVGPGSVSTLVHPDPAARLVEGAFANFPWGARPPKKERDQRDWPIGLGPR